MELDGPVVGLRLWMVNRQTYRLKATNAVYDWRPGKNEAVCNKYVPPIFWRHHPSVSKRSTHYGGEVPVEGCVCGFHAFYDLDGLREFFDNSVMGMLMSAGLIGVVRGWGRTQLHPNGWRALYAEPMALFKDLHESRNEDMLEPMARRYQIPILNASAYPHVMSEFGSIVPEEMRPDEEPRKNAQNP